MKAIHIVPTAHIWDYKQPGQAHLPLAHRVINDRDYALAYRKIAMNGSDCTVILDNGAFELREAIDDESLMLAMDMIHPHEVVLPDVLRDSRQTVARSRDFIYKVRRQHPNMRFMGVPQGHTYAAWLQCLDELLSIEAVTCIGVFEETEDWHLRGRIGILEDIQERVDEADVDVHLLGFCEDLHDMWEIPRRFPWVRTMDSCKVCVWSMNGVDIEPGCVPPPYPGRPKDFFDRRMTPAALELFRRNVAKIDDYLAKAN